MLNAAVLLEGPGLVDALKPIEPVALVLRDDGRRVPLRVASCRLCSYLHVRRNCDRFNVWTGGEGKEFQYDTLGFAQRAFLQEPPEKCRSEEAVGYQFGSSQREPGMRANRFACRNRKNCNMKRKK